MLRAHPAGSLADRRQRRDERGQGQGHCERRDVRGSTGHEGSALDLFPDLVRWTDCVCAACDPVVYPALAEAVREVRLGPVKGRAKDCPFAQALVVPPPGCGVGACQGCAVSMADGFKLACTDGPVFDLLELR